jgi:hypothetical protein
MLSLTNFKANKNWLATLLLTTQQTSKQPSLTVCDWQVTHRTRIRRGGSFNTRIFHLTLFFTDSVQIYIFMPSSSFPFSEISGFYNTDPLKIAQYVRRNRFISYLNRSYHYKPILYDILQQIYFKKLCV